MVLKGQPSRPVFVALHLGPGVLAAPAGIAAQDA